MKKQFNTMGGKKSCNKNLIPLSKMELANLWTCHLGKNPSQQNGFTRQNWLQMESWKTKFASCDTKFWAKKAQVLTKPLHPH